MGLYGALYTGGAEADPAGLTDVVAAGTVPYRLAADGSLEFALVHRPRYDDWSLPKGHQDPGEALTLTALRETAEEAHLGCRLGGRLGHTTYTVPGKGRKVVHYWAAEVVDDQGFTATDETDELRWAGAAEASGLVEHEHDRTLIARLSDAGVPTSTVLFVRHAKAGSRSAWEGDDDLRPLSGTGHTQADRLASFLPRFGADRAYTAPPLRCGETIAPLVERSGLGEPGVEPLLGEHDYWTDPPAGLARFRELAALPGVTLLSSQGGVIPDVVEQLLDGSGAGHGDVPSHKASTWVLGFGTGGALLFADYYRRPPG
ncbi:MULTISPECIES: bifunctional NUDIX hydrolase/histidine phosphatase family protein [unclassified Pseudonocardia]|uniref:NUDIX hydrolase n=1 Tax=unclassified Pseudonocardia TaxID=2619320 RepID=UPI0001FFDECC|nr:bifunctional NUDIX hydrolase/histidine phosphatase family protein [Pseudonocardia sp. Ae707_Ps1]OLM20228.1 Hydrolase MutT1 [Pseudonocardia sp. Ae707_Ps1]